MNEVCPPANQPLPASYRDPSGFVFAHDGTIYRQVNASYQLHYDFFMQSGLYRLLVEKNLLIPHREILPGENIPAANAWKILQPERIGFISYPYEWSFSMLKDAALLTLRIAAESLSHGMILKDATPYNVQYHKGRLVFIDTLSFEKYEEGQPWIAYRQFCEQFLGPLLLMAGNKTSLHPLLLAYPDGIPLQLVSRWLPWRSRFNMLTYLHIHLHARVAGKNKGRDESQVKVSREKLSTLIRSLTVLIEGLQLKEHTVWKEYYEEASQRDGYIEQKKDIINTWIQQLPALQTGIDFGANEGLFARLLSERNIHTLAADIDPGAIDNLYTKNKEKDNFLQPLLTDLSCPSPATGVNNEERNSFTERVAGRDIGLALALIHHLCLGKNIPFRQLARMFANSCRWLIIEFVPVSDPRSKQLLLNKKQIYQWYSPAAFEEVFGEIFFIRNKQPVPGTERVIYLMEKKHGDA